MVAVGQVQLLFSKSKVYIHPTKSSKDQICGYIALVRPLNGGNSDMLVSWVPESLIRLSKTDFESYVQVDLDDSGSPQISSQQPLVSPPPTSTLSSHAFSVSIRDIYSIQVREPSLGWWYGSIQLITRGSDTLPTLYFHDSENQAVQQERKKRAASFDPFTDDQLPWGGASFMAALKKYAKVVSSPQKERGVYLVNPDLTEMRAKPSSGNNASSKRWEDVKWGIFEKLAQVTKLSRTAGRHVIDRTPAPMKSMLNIPEVEQLSQDYDSAKAYLAEWAVGIAKDRDKKKYDVVWTDGYDNLLGDEDFSFVSMHSGVERRNPVTLAEWKSFFGMAGQISVTVDEILERIFHGGLEPPARPEAWLFLLGVYPWHSTAKERVAIVADKRNEYYRLKRRWWDDTERQANDDFWKDQKSRIEKDVLRTDRQLEIFGQSDIPHPDPDSRFASSGANPHLEQLKDLLITYNEYNENLGYVQGMTDLLSPLYVVLQDDSLAFCAFCAFMRRMERNFVRDQSGMRDQLTCLDHLVQLMLPRLYEHLAKADSTHFFFFFRMLLVWYKREFDWDDCLRLWEVLWTDYLSSQFHLLIALAILDLNKEVIMNRLHHFDEILKYINDLGMSLDLEAVLVRAEQLFNHLRKTIELVDYQVSRKHRTDLPHIPDDVRLLLSRQVVEVRESKRPPGTGGG